MGKEPGGVVNPPEILFDPDLSVHDTTMTGAVGIAVTAAGTALAASGDLRFTPPREVTVRLAVKRAESGALEMRKLTDAQTAENGEAEVALGFVAQPLSILFECLTFGLRVDVEGRERPYERVKNEDGTWTDWVPTDDWGPWRGADGDFEEDRNTLAKVRITHPQDLLRNSRTLQPSAAPLTLGEIAKLEGEEKTAKFLAWCAASPRFEAELVDAWALVSTEPPTPGSTSRLKGFIRQAVARTALRSQESLLALIFGMARGDSRGEAVNAFLDAVTSPAMALAAFGRIKNSGAAEDWQGVKLGAGDMALQSLSFDELESVAEEWRQTPVVHAVARALADKLREASPASAIDRILAFEPTTADVAMGNYFSSLSARHARNAIDAFFTHEKRLSPRSAEEALKGVIGGLRGSELSDAATQAQRIDSPEVRLRALETVFSHWLSEDQAGASSYVNDMPTGPAKDEVITAVVDGLVGGGRRNAAAQWAVKASDATLAKRLLKLATE